MSTLDATQDNFYVSVIGIFYNKITFGVMQYGILNAISFFKHGFAFAIK
jgi:hypothetical protein